MQRKRRVSYSELKVGIFVLIALMILAVAIFTIGTQVGLFEDTFVAKTYLNSVSGLKPGDIVLLAGVEAGNVTDVQVAPAGQLPKTEANRRSLRLIDDLGQRIRQLEGMVPQTQAALNRVRGQHRAVVVRTGPESRQAEQLQLQVNQLEGELSNQLTTLQEAREAHEDARAQLQSIIVYMEIKEEYRDWIKADSNISLGSIGLLGDKYIDVSLGRSGAPPPIDRERVEGWFGPKTQEVLVITGTVQAGFQELITGADDVLANFEILSRRLQNIMAKFETGEGSVGKFFNDPTFYNNLNRAVVGARQSIDEASQVMRDIARGPGTVGLLIQEREVYDKINVSIARLENVMAQIEQGEGTLGKFVSDPSLYQKSDKVMENIQGITQRIQAGHGTLGKLSTDDQLYQDLHRTLDQLGRLATDIEQGKGTLGRLVKDEKLYQNLNQVSSEIVKLIYDFRQNPKKFLTINFKLF